MDLVLMLRCWLLLVRNRSCRLLRYVPSLFCREYGANPGDEQYVRPRGTVVVIGLPANAYIKAPVFSTVIRQISIKGSYVGNRKDTSEAIQFFREGKIVAPYKTLGLSELPKI